MKALKYNIEAEEKHCKQKKIDSLKKTLDKSSLKALFSKLRSKKELSPHEKTIEKIVTKNLRAGTMR